MKIALSHRDDLVGSALADALKWSSHELLPADAKPLEVAEQAEAEILLPALSAEMGKADLVAAADKLCSRIDAVPGTRKVVVLVSSMLVFGDRGGVENRQRIDENTPMVPPGTPYTEQLRRVEDHFRATAARKKMPACILRTGIPYAPVPMEEKDLKDGAFARYLVRPMREREFRTPGGGVNNVCFVHAEDLASAILKVLDEPGKAAGKSYILADGHDVTLADVVGRLARQLKIARPEDNTGFLLRWGWCGAVDKVLMYQQKAETLAFRRDFGWEPREKTIVEELA